MSIGASAVWECRTAGAELNGGGFALATAGTDFSQRDTKRTAGDVTNISATDCSTTGSSTVNSASMNSTVALVGNTISLSGGTRSACIDATDIVANGTTTITSATATFNSNNVGALVKLSGGTGSLPAQWYRIATAPNPTTITVDRAVATGTGITAFFAVWVQVSSVTNTTQIVVDRAHGLAGSGMTLNIGGALSNPIIALNSAHSSNKLWLKGDGTYTSAVGMITPTGYGSPTNTLPPAFIRGYGTVRGDSGRATLQLTGATSGLFMLKFITASWQVENLIFDANNLAVSTCISMVSGDVTNCKFMNFTNAGIYQTGTSCMIYGNEFTGATGSSAAIWTTGVGNVIDDNYIHDCALSGSAQAIYAAGAGNTVTRNIVANCSGATTDGIQFFVTSTQQAWVCRDNIVYNCGQNGISVLGTAIILSEVIGNIVSNNGAYGIKFGQASGQRATLRWDGNVYYANTSGTRFGGDDTTTTNKQNAAGAYTNVYDVILSSSPFINASGGDFRLNSNTAGLACRGSSQPRTWPGLTTTPRGFSDIGPIQHQEQGQAG